MNWQFDRETTLKTLRLAICSLMFLCVTNIMGLNLRAAHQLFFSLACIIIFALLVRNIWLTLFIWWASILFTIFKFECGQVYITNIFYGAVLYYITKLAFEKKHIDFFIKIVLWVVTINLFYGILQALDFDFIYLKSESLNIPFMDLNLPSPNGFMGNSGVAASLYCLAIPLIATRGKKSIWIAISMLIPIFILRSSTSMIGAVVIIMFLLWFRVSKKMWFTALASLLVLAGVYFSYFDIPGMERVNTWKLSLIDAKIHPLKGWGMDSYRKVTKFKPQYYVTQPESKSHSSLWDNPHNLLISLFYEFGIVSLLLLIGYLRQVIMWFRKSLKDPNTIALAGFILAFFIISMGNFPAFLARMMVIIIPCLALYEVQTNG